MNKNAWVETEEYETEKQRREKTKLNLPVRCRRCRDYQNCDLEFCLKWWH